MDLFTKTAKPPFVVVDLPKTMRRPQRIDDAAKTLDGELVETDEVSYWNRHHYSFPTVAAAQKFVEAVSPMRLPFRAITLVR